MMPNEIYLILNTVLTREEFEKVKSYIENLQGRVDDCKHYLEMMLPENEDAFYCTQILDGKYDNHIPMI